MRKQSPNDKRSKKLSAFLNNRNNFKFNLHGFEEFAINHSRKTVQKQEDALLLGRNEVWFAPSIGQPFLFWSYRKEIDISGVIDYSPKTQCGTFWHRTCMGILKVKNVHSYEVFVRINGKYLPSNSRYMPDENEINDIILVATIATKSQFDLKVFHNTELLFSQSNVFPEVYIYYGENTPYLHRLSYVRYASCSDSNNIFRNYIYDINKQCSIEMDDSCGFPSWYIDYSKYPSNGGQITGQNLNIRIAHGLKIIMHFDNSKAAYIALSYIRDTADSYHIMDNIFSDDDTINYEAIYTNKPDCIRFLYYCAKVNQSIFGSAILGLPINSYEAGARNHYLEYKNIIQMPHNEIMYFKQVNKELFERCDEFQGINVIPKKIYQDCISSHDMICYMFTYLRDSVPSGYEVPWILSYMGKGILNKSFDVEKQLYDELYQCLVKAGNVPVRWKNEYTLFVQVQNIYPDSQYQFHSKWLGHQSLDIFIPSKKVGIEYQGLQHYNAVDFFGGESKLKAQQLLDKEKKKKCKENGIKLIEWRFDEPICKSAVVKKLQID